MRELKLFFALFIPIIISIFLIISIIYFGAISYKSIEYCYQNGILGIQNCYNIFVNNVDILIPIRLIGKISIIAFFFSIAHVIRIKYFGHDK